MSSRGWGIMAPVFPPPRAASLAVLTSAALLAPASAALASDPSLDTTERWMLGQVNAARATAGVGPLEGSTALARAADGYASYLAAHPTATGHEADGRTVGQRLQAAGWPDLGGYAEDVFTSRTEGAQDALDAWLASPAHRANILDASLRSIGVARSSRSWVLDFGRACPTSGGAADPACGMTGDRGDASLPIGTAATGTTSTGTTTSTAAPAPTGTAATGSTAAAPAASTAAAPTSAGTTTGTAAATATPLRVSAVRTRGQVVTVTVAVARERRRAVRVTATRAGRTVPLRLSRTRALAGGRVARTYARKLPTGTWKIHAQLRRTRGA